MRSLTFAFSDSSPAAVLFDVDGTLGETHFLHFEAYKQAFAPIAAAPAIEWSDYVIYCLRGGLKFEELLIRKGVHLEMLGLADLYVRKSLVYGQLASQMLRLREGLVDLWCQLRDAGIEIGLVSSARRASVETFLENARLPFPPSVVISREDVGDRSKPDPWGYLLASQRLSAEAAQCLVFEDSPGGIAAAKSAGMRCVALQSAVFTASDLLDANAVISDFRCVSVLEVANGVDLLISCL